MRPGHWRTPGAGPGHSRGHADASPSHRCRTAMNAMRLARTASTVAVASIAAWSSWSHMVHVALRFGERPEVAYVLPLSVDGMLIVATTVMVDDKRHGGRVRWSARIAFVAGVAASVGANIAAAAPTIGARVVAAWPAIALLLVVEMLARTSTSTNTGAAEVRSVIEPSTPPTSGTPSTGSSAATGEKRPGVAVTRKTQTRRSAAETSQAIANLREQRPAATAAHIAASLGISERHVRRLLSLDPPMGIEM
ncbi:DUF2637 domain-containing protein [Dactylosporangium sp. NPDC051541]|uniref:DUF2637 domain-containing protein n=1 Tax=Dactylosporangium sp. NPDC051541 TaxID=3363977 RepID=UPI00378D3283